MWKVDFEKYKQGNYSSDEIRARAEFHRMNADSGDLEYLDWTINDYNKWMELIDKKPNTKITPSHIIDFTVHFDPLIDESVNVIFDGGVNMYTYPLYRNKSGLYNITIHDRNLVNIVYSHITKKPLLPNSVVFTIDDLYSPITSSNIHPLGIITPHPLYGKYGYGVVNGDRIYEGHRFRIITDKIITIRDIDGIIHKVIPRSVFLRMMDEEIDSFDLDEETIVVRDSKLVSTTHKSKSDILFDEWASNNIDILKEFYIKNHM